MTPADLAMKAALDEGARYADSPPAMASSARSLPARPPRPNLTSLGPHLQKPSETAHSGLDRPVTPHITLHQFHKVQHSLAPSSSPDLDHKRVRRKHSFARLSRPPADLGHGSAHHTSSSSSLHSKPSQNFVPSLLPPLPLTPLPRPGTTSPSLSSTVDTLQSTPTHTPIHRGLWPAEQWEDLVEGDFSEPIRTKRKFLPVKQAKRLPHHSAHEAQGEGIWEVHAAVIDIGDLGELDKEALHVTRSEGRGRRPRALGREEEASRRRGRLVRFEGIDAEESSSSSNDHASPRTASQEKQEPTLTSSFSLSKFKFPAPPGSNWEGAFGHLGDPTPPTSPATVHYRGASFDVVNPHTSFLLGVSDIETPAEIDGLLDNYFDREGFNMMPYNDRTEERSASQLSFQTSGSNGRQRVLYDDPSSARRNIMGLSANSSQQTVIHHPLDESRSETPPLPATTSRRPSTPEPYSFNQSRGVYVHPNLRANLRDLIDIDEAANARIARRNAEIESTAAAESQRFPEQAENVDESSVSQERLASFYARSTRSNPFDLTLSDDEDDASNRNVDDVVAGGRSSCYAAGGDDEGDVGMDEDAGETNARTRSTLEPETTIAHIVGHYHYPRDWEPETSPYEDESSQSASIGIARGGHHAINPPYSHEDSRQNEEFTPGLARSSSLLRERPRPPPRGPPNVMIPTPPMPTRPNRIPFPYLDPVSTDQTYGDTNDLFDLRPQYMSHTRRQAHHDIQVYGYGSPAPSRQLQYNDAGFEESTPVPFHFRPRIVPPPVESESEDKENTPPPEPEDRGSLSVTPAAERTYNPGPRRGPATIVNVPADLLPSETSFYSDEESMWESMHGSDNGESAGEATEEFNMGLDTHHQRQSQDSYADTSIAGSTIEPSPSPRLPSPPGPPRRPPRPEVSWAGPGRPSNLSGLLWARDHPDHEAKWYPNQTVTIRRMQNTLEREAEKVLSGAASPDAHEEDESQNREDLKQLNEDRKRNPKAFEKAVSAVTDKMMGVSSSAFKATNESPSTETQGLLSPQNKGGFDTRDSGSPFPTTRYRSQTINQRPTTPHSMLSSPLPRPSRALLRDSNAARVRLGYRAAPPPETETGEKIELQERTARRTAMSNQTELRNFQLAGRSGASGSGGRLTDDQLAEHAKRWTMQPKTTGVSVSNVENGAALLNPSQVRDEKSEKRRIQRNFTRPYKLWLCWCPLTALIFGLGGFDWRMRQMTNGKIKEMSPSAKKMLLLYFFPLGLILYILIGLAIGLPLEIVKCT